MSEFKNKKILIVGGGTAGWMAANLLIKFWGGKGFEIQLLESRDIGIIGVGEGSTPQMKIFFDMIGVSESEWMPECSATYKNAIAFVNWSVHKGFEQYYHPFPAKTDFFTTSLFFRNSTLRRKNRPVSAHPDDYFLATYLAKQALGPKPNYSFPFDVAYGYHFDSFLLGKFLSKKAIARGVQQVLGTVASVELSENGDIRDVVLDTGDKIVADFFIDCTGFSSILLQQALEVPFISFKNNLFNDSAVVFPTKSDLKIFPETRSTALQFGWAWKIPLINRTGNGYVYSSSYCNSDDAEFELRKHLGMLNADLPVRHLRMKVGRAEQHWKNNCLAVGLSQGFIEPLEATALHLVQETIMSFIRLYENGGFTRKYQAQFNEEINARFEGIRDYIVCHYRVSSRSDTQYWLDNSRNNQLSNSLLRILNAWFNEDDFVSVLRDNNLEKYYQAESWACLLAGYGVYPNALSLAEASQEVDAANDFIKRSAMNFASHSEQLKLVGVNKID